MLKKTIYIITFAFTIVLLAACGGESESSNSGGQLITISGSTSIGLLAEKLTMKYEEITDVKIENMEFIVTEDGQKIVESAGAIPLTK